MKFPRVFGSSFRAKLIAGACLMTAATAALGILALHLSANVARTVSVATKTTTPLLSTAVRVSELTGSLTAKIRDLSSNCSRSPSESYGSRNAEIGQFERQLGVLHDAIAQTELREVAIVMSLNGLALSQILLDMGELCSERIALLASHDRKVAEFQNRFSDLRQWTGETALALEQDTSDEEESLKVGHQIKSLDNSQISEQISRFLSDAWPTLRSIYRMETLAHRASSSIDTLSGIETTEDLARMKSDHLRLSMQMTVLADRLLPRLKEKYSEGRRDEIDRIRTVVSTLEKLATGKGGLFELRRQILDLDTTVAARRRVADSVDSEIRGQLNEIEAVARRTDRSAHAEMDLSIRNGHTVIVYAVSLIAIGAFLLAMYFARILSRPLVQLADATEKLRDDRDYSITLPTSLTLRKDEIGALARSFDNLIVSLARAERELLDDTRRQIRIQAERLTLAFETIPLGLYLLDANGDILVANNRIAAMYGFTSREIAGGTNVEEIIEKRFANGMGPIGKSIEAILSRRSDGLSLERDVEHLPDGRVVIVTVAPAGDGGSLVIHEDVTERHRAELRIMHMARHDALTGLPNRTAFREHLAECIARLPEGNRLGLLYLDLDQFKAVNDTLGHPVGDRLLIAAAKRLQSQLGEHDQVARLGGDEFALVLGDNVRPEDAADVADRIIEILGQPFEVDGHHIVVGASVGIAMAPSDAADEDRLLKNADMALYRAKKEGRGTHRFFEAEMDRLMQTRRALELDLRKAISSGQMELYYQPLVGIDGKRIDGFEALLRWHHPERGLVSPLDFIPLAEETGLIGQLGAWVLKEACLAACSWPESIRVAVNVSPIQFRSRALILDVIAALGASELRPDRLEIEITEGVLLSDTESTLGMLQQIRALGVRIAMDDFGTGYSSLSYLRKFNFDKVKIDQSFIRELDETPDSLAIVRAVTSLCHSLGISTTAEGVETEQQLQTLEREGCHQVQGFLFGRPMPLAEASEKYFGVDGPNSRRSIGIEQ